MDDGHFFVWKYGKNNFSKRQSSVKNPLLVAKHIAMNSNAQTNNVMKNKLTPFRYACVASYKSFSSSCICPFIIHNCLMKKWLSVHKQETLKSWYHWYYLQRNLTLTITTRGFSNIEYTSITTVNRWHISVRFQIQPTKKHVSYLRERVVFS